MIIFIIPFYDKMIENDGRPISQFSLDFDLNLHPIDISGIIINYMGNVYCTCIEKFLFTISLHHLVSFALLMTEINLEISHTWLISSYFLIFFHQDLHLPPVKIPL